MEGFLRLPGRVRHTNRGLRRREAPAEPPSWGLSRSKERPGGGQWPFLQLERVAGTGPEEHARQAGWTLS